MTGLAATAKQGKQLATLEALRDELAQAIEADRCFHCNEPHSSIASPAARLVEVLQQIEVVKLANTPKGKTPLDEVTKRRNQRQPKAALR